MIVYFQVMTLYSSSFSAVRWPKDWDAFAGALDVFTFNPLTVFAPSCVDPSWRIDAFFRLFTTSGPAIALISLAFVASKLRPSWRQWCAGQVLIVMFFFYPSVTNAAFQFLGECREVCDYEGQTECHRTWSTT